MKEYINNLTVSIGIPKATLPLGYENILDASGLRCPHPILETKKKIQTLEPRAVLLVITQEFSYKIDLSVFAKKNGHQLLQSWQDGPYYYHVIQKMG